MDPEYPDPDHARGLGPERIWFGGSPKRNQIEDD
jgi:hypothetical protein